MGRKRREKENMLRQAGTQSEGRGKSMVDREGKKILGREEGMQGGRQSVGRQKAATARVEGRMGRKAATR